MRQIVRVMSGIDTYSTHDAAALADELMNGAKWPLRWIKKSCAIGTRVPNGNEDHAYAAAGELSKLASDYLPFEGAFTYASLGLLELRLQDNRIVPSGDFRQDMRFEAYGRLVDLSGKEGVSIDLESLSRKLARTIRIDGDRFSVPLNPRLVKESLEEFETVLDSRFTLPVDWKLADYTLAEFAEVAKVLWVLSTIHFNSRVIAALKGCPGLGYSQSLVLMGEDELNRRVARYTKLSPERVRSILHDMTYGAGNLRSPDPALQPLIRLTPTTIGWAPNLIINNAFERNFIVLANRIPERRDLYSKISQQKEERLRIRIRDAMAEFGLRSWHGIIHSRQDDLDIDLAVVSDAEKRCLILELKSFIAPAEPREIRDRSEEIRRGIAQIHERKLLAKMEPDVLRRSLQIDASYTLTWAVVSETSIGAFWVQDDSVAVVNAGHLIQKLRTVRQLAAVSEWLEEREYLPAGGRDYEVIDHAVTVGKWTMDWYGIKGLSGFYV